MAAEDGGSVRVGQASASVTMTDPGSLLSPALRRAIVAEVLQALDERQAGLRSLRSDTRIGAGCGCGEAGGE
jgi:hypothetical protein